MTSATRYLDARTVCVLAAALAVSTGLPAVAFLPGDGHGNPARDCHIGLDGYADHDLMPFGRKGRSRAIACTDCDPTCDLDGAAMPNGACTFRVAACVNRPGDGACSPSRLRRIRAKARAQGGGALNLAAGLPRTGHSGCGAFQDFVVPLRAGGRRPGRGVVRLATTAPRDRDRFVFACLPRPEDEPCPTVTTTTVTTNTTMPPDCWHYPHDPRCTPPNPSCEVGDDAALQFTSRPGTSDCGYLASLPPAQPPFGAELHDETGATVANLGSGCIHIGGGWSTVPPGAVPDGATSIYGIAQSWELCPDIYLLTGGGEPGQVGCTFGADSSDRVCANGMPGTDGAGSCADDADCLPVCQDPSGGPCETGETCSCANGARGVCTSNGDCGTGSTILLCTARPRCFLGPPLPVHNATLSTCIQNVYANDASGVADPATGEMDLALSLSARTFLTGIAFGLDQPCPSCVQGICDGGPNAGRPCTAVGAAATSHECPPFGHQYLAPIDLPLSPLTTGTVMLPADGSISPDGLFCPGQTNPGAFFEPDARRIVATGSPAAGGLSETPTPAMLASVFCIPRTGNVLIDGVANLPGPGVITLPGDVLLLTEKSR